MLTTDRPPPALMFGSMPPDPVSYPGKQEDVEHPDTVWDIASNARLPLVRLVAEYKVYLSGRTNRVAQGTERTYGYTLNNFMHYLERRGDAVVLSSVTPFAVRGWVADLRAQKRTEEGVATRVNQLKVFTHKFVFKELELTTIDLLGRVERMTAKVAVIPALDAATIEEIFDGFEPDDPTDLRDRAFVAACASTGLRFSEVLGMTVSGLDRVSGEFVVTVKGGDEHLARVSPKALRFVKAYLRRRPEVASDRLWLSDVGRPLGYQGAQYIFRRVSARVGQRVHAHLFRHTFAQHALASGAGSAEVQDMLGHKSPAMTRRYTGNARKRRAAQLMPVYSPI